MTARLIRHIAIAVVVMLLASCRKELCYEFHDNNFEILVEVDSTYMDIFQNEMRIDFYAEGSKRQYTRFVNTRCNTVILPAGKYEAVIFNDNSDYIQYTGCESVETYKAYLPYITRSQFNMLYSGAQVPYSRLAPALPANHQPVYSDTRGDQLTLTIGQPDPLYAHTNLNIIVTGDPLTQQVIRFTPRSMVVVYHMEIEVLGMHNALMARGIILEAAAPAKYLYSQQREFVDHVGIMFDCVCLQNRVTASITSFGLILGNGPGSKNANQIILDFLLKDGTTHRETFDITDRLTEQECIEGGTIEMSGFRITLPEVEPKGGFDPKVEEWGEEEVIEL